MKKKALITGITGQDGSYLAELLLSKNYIVHGIKRKSSSLNTKRIDHIYQEPYQKRKNFFLHYGDMTDSSSLSNIINLCMPDEIYNLAAQSHVGVSFEQPEYTANVDGLGTLRILEIVKNLRNKKKIKFYQAGTSELFGKVQEIPQTEKTKFYPRSPYAVSKLFSHWITVNYREAYGLFASNGILFNHESPRRGETFVTKKITQGLVKIKLGLQKQLYLGNLEAKRDWGHAKDYVEAQWLIMQQNKPDDFVIATGRNYSVKYFVDKVCKYLKIKIRWKGKGINTKGYDDKGKLIVSCDKKYFRPTEVDTLLGNSLKAKKILKWKTKNDLNSLIREMVNQDMKDFS
ncbi:GDP-mannose 4,6-dehydratase [Pelagibacterales bacterium SAG-MED08]|nr:GDP-mannose 4,6-dehydratase [Pelagibacterales bacterium SAG-MED08]